MLNYPTVLKSLPGARTVLKSLMGAPTVLFKDFYDAPLAHFMHVEAYAHTPWY
jgi:hypothetical protein